MSAMGPVRLAAPRAGAVDERARGPLRSGAMRTLVHAFSRLYLVASLFTWLPASAPGSVLCVEPDGNVKVETSAECCAGGDAAVAQPAPGDGVQSDGCGDCLDIRLGGPHGHPAATGAGVPQPAAALAPLHCGAHPTGRATAPGLAVSPGLEPGARPALRTTLLRN